MASPRRLILMAILISIAAATMLAGVSAGGAEDGLAYFPAAKRSCDSSIGECLAEEEELMSSEISRRILATSKYISYGALQRNTVPCSRRGASYYNCQAGGQANPYSRSCSAISRCRS